MNKFENVDVLASLQQIMQQNTAAFQNDFDIDKKILTQAAKSKNAEDKVYLWFSRPNGTHCLRERDVFLRGTREHNTFRFYHEQTKERVLAYAVVLSGVESRTSSPVRIVRDKDSLEANYEGIYPCGEGAGYAGGITSAAMDGIKVAEAVSKKFRNF